MIDRRTIIRKSAEAFVRNELFVVRNYPQDKVIFLDAYPTGDRMMKPIDNNYVTIGYSADDGGRQAELGTSLTRRKHTFDFYVFGKSRVWAENIASVLGYSLESAKTINLVDPADGVTIIDNVAVDFVSAQQVTTRTPHPWEENVWVTRLRVEDIYSSAGGG